MLTVLVNTISNSQVFLQKNVSSFCKYTLTNDIVSFEQVGPEIQMTRHFQPVFLLQEWKSSFQACCPWLCRHIFSSSLRSHSDAPHNTWCADLGSFKICIPTYISVS